MNYNKVVIEHFLSPKNLGKLKKFNFIAEAANPTCGDAVKFYFDISDKNIINDIGIEVLGCGAAIASSSMASVILKGKTLEDATKINNSEIVDALGGLPQEKINCSLLVEQAMQNIKKV